MLTKHLKWFWKWCSLKRSSFGGRTGRIILLDGPLWRGVTKLLMARSLSLKNILWKQLKFEFYLSGWNETFGLLWRVARCLPTLQYARWLFRTIIPAGFLGISAREHLNQASQAYMSHDIAKLSVGPDHLLSLPRVPFNAPTGSSSDIKESKWVDHLYVDWPVAKQQYASNAGITGPTSPARLTSYIPL